MDSAFSDMARMASPHLDHLTNAANATATMGATISVSTWPDVNR